MEEIAASNPKALEIVQEAVKLAMNMKVVPGEGMWDMMKGMSMERMKDMAGGMMPEGFIESLNAKLIKIKKD